MLLTNIGSSSIRFGLVLLTSLVMTLAYYSFSHYVHHLHFDPKKDHEHEHHDGKNHRGGPFEDVYMKKQDLFLYGFALPLALLTLVSLVWNHRAASVASVASVAASNPLKRTKHSRGEVNVKFWTYICFLLPLLLIAFDGASDRLFPGHQQKQLYQNWYWRICMSLMSPSGYAAVWALAAFLIPVSKHSPILDWLNVTSIQALAFHRISGWISLWASTLHGFLHLQHLMDVLNARHPNPRPWYQELWILLVPPSWECISYQNPFAFVFGHQEHYHDLEDKTGSQCWLALVNATGMISVLAFWILAITSLPSIRRSCYSLFYKVHIPMAWTMMITAIWHYPTCALVLIPNIIYYLSFNIPVYVTQIMDRWRNNNTSPLVQANLIKGGSLELVFSTKSDECRRHENRFVRLYHSGVSGTSHPFSIFSPQDLLTKTRDESLMATNSVLLRPTGPFTKGLIKILFPSHHSNAQLDDQDGDDLMSYTKLQFDSYYAGSFGWVDHAMLSHDSILLVAGGVGILPFLEFLPSLQERIIAAQNFTSTGDEEDEDELLQELCPSVGPKKIHMHWYCRDIGLASHIWCTYLRPHILNTWECEESCQGRLKIHLHLTSMTRDDSLSSSLDSGNLTEQDLMNLPNCGLVQKRSFSADNYVQDAPTATLWWFSLFVPGSIMAIGTALHWWWYKQIIINDEFRMDNLVMRAHSIVWTLVAAVIISSVGKHLLYYFFVKDNSTVRNNAQDESPGDQSTHCVTAQESNFPCFNTVLKLSRGRPSISTVVNDVLNAKRPGVYMCGPQSLMESVEKMVQDEHQGCAFYREDSNM